MNSIDKSWIAYSSILTIAATAFALIACSKDDLEKTLNPMAQPLLAAPIKTSAVNYSGLDPHIVIDVNGNATAVWEEYDGTRFNIWTKRRIAGQIWSNPSLLEKDNSGDAYSPQIAIDGIGNVTVVWKQSDGKRFSIYANRYVNDIGWEGATQIENGIDKQVNASAPLVTYDASGYAMVAWQQTQGLTSKTWINHHRGAAGWGQAEQIDENYAGIEYPRFELSSNGLMTVIAQKTDSKRYQ
jgi:hypothetical protein